MRSLLSLQPDTEPFPGYMLRQCIGRGGFAEVWEATSPTGARIALKFMRTKNMAANALEVRGIQAMKRLRHPFLLYLHQVFTIPGSIVISMELADGSLDDLLRASFSEFGTAIDPTMLCRYLGQAAKAIDFLNTRQHQVDGQRFSFQHADIKPSNILLCDGDVAKLADFGTAVPMTGSRMMRTPLGTLDFAPPEVFQSELTDRSDQFALAVTYCLLRGGKLPFKDTPPSFGSPCPRSNPDLTMLPECERPIIARGLHPTPQDRWPSCWDLIDAIASLYGIRLDITTHSSTMTGATNAYQGTVQR